MKGKGIKLLSLVTLLSIALSVVSIAQAQSTSVYIDPEENTANPSETFTINVNVQDVTGLYSYGIKIQFNRYVLEVVSITEGPFISSGAPTAFVYRIYANYIDVGCSTLGASPGASGSGTLFTVEFHVKDAGTSDLDMYYSVLLDPTITPIPHTATSGYFYTTAKANVVKRSAWPEHHHFDVSKDEDYNATTDEAQQTLTAKVENLASTHDLYIYVHFEIVRDDGFVASATTETVLVSPGVIIDLSADITVNSTDVGKYAVAAKAYYSWTGTHFTQGDKVKTFSFAVVP